MRPLPRPVPQAVSRPTLYLLGLLLILTSTALVHGGCGDGDATVFDPTDSVIATETSDPGTTASAVEPTILSTTVTSTSGSESVSTSSEEVLPNGNIKACGIIKEVSTDGSTHKITIDYVDFLTGDEADAAAVADGEITAGQHVENEYYVRNNSTKLRTFAVSGSALMTTDDRSHAPGQIVTHTWSEFSDFWKLSGEEAWLSRGYWWIERDGDTVVKIEQQFIP